MGITNPLPNSNSQDSAANQPGMPAMFSPPDDGINVEKAYRGSYGKGLDDGEVIVDPLGVRTGQEGYDLRPGIHKRLKNQYEILDNLLEDGHSFRASVSKVAEIQKGLNTSDYQLPVFPLEDLTMLTRRATPFWDFLPKIAAKTDSVTQDSVTELSQPEIGGERDVPPDSDATIKGQQLDMTYYRITGSVSGPMQLASAPLRNAQSVAERNKAQAMGHFSANLALNGDPTAGDTSGGITDERGHKGARTYAIDNSEVYAPQGGDGTTLTVADVRANIRRAANNGGSIASMVHVTDLASIQDLKADINEVNQVEVTGGPDGTIEVGGASVMIDGTPVMHSSFMPQVPYDSTNNPSGRELLTVDMRFHSVHQLSGLVMEPLAKISDADRFFMKQYSVYMMAQGASDYMALIQGLA